MNNFIIPGKVNILIDTQLGSTGKGLIANKIALENHVDLALGCLSPNAGHTFYYQNKKYLTHLIPVAGIIHDRSTIYLSADSVIDIDLLLKEIKDFDIDPNRIFIHPNASIVMENEKINEQSIEIASTLQGTGPSRASKILRTNPLVRNTPNLKTLVKKLNIHDYIRSNLNILVETGQGYSLGINQPFYPHVTSINRTPSSILSEYDIHPRYLGNVMGTMRTFPIRVGNIYENDKLIGYSGDFYKDSTEISFKDLNVEEEYTSVTKRVRRIATFSWKHLQEIMDVIQPDYIFLNFINYLRESDLHIFNTIFNKLNQTKKVFIGYGPYAENICRYDRNVLENYLYKHK